MTPENVLKRLLELGTHIKEKICTNHNCATELATLVWDLDAMCRKGNLPVSWSPAESDAAGELLTSARMQSEFAAAWARYRTNHPDVVASWGEQNGYWPNCTCPACDPDHLLPRPNLVAGRES